MAAHAEFDPVVSQRQLKSMTAVRALTNLTFIFTGPKKSGIPGGTHRDGVTGKQLSLIGDDDRKLVPMLQVNGQPIKVILVFLKEKVFGTFTSHRVDKQNDLVCPQFDRHSKLQSLTGRYRP